MWVVLFSIDGLYSLIQIPALPRLEKESFILLGRRGGFSRAVLHRRGKKALSVAGEERAQKINESYASRLDPKRRRRWGRVRETRRRAASAPVSIAGRRESQNQDPGRDHSEVKTRTGWCVKATGNPEKHPSSYLFHFLQPDNPQKRPSSQKVPD